MNREEFAAAVDRHAYLRGLVVVPWGAGLLLLGVLSAWQSAEGRPPHVRTSALLLVLAMVALTVRGWYRDRLGRASYRHDGARRAVAAPVLVILVLAGALLEQRLHGEIPGVPWWVRHASVLTALSALGMLTWHRLRVGSLPHHAWLWGAALALGCLPVWGHGPTLDPTTLVRSQAFMTLGGALALGGVLDHRVLLSGLPSPEAAAKE